MKKKNSIFAKRQPSILISIIIPLAYFCITLIFFKDKPLVGYFDGGGFVHIAHNYHKYGYLNNHFSQIKYKNYDESFGLYANHPPLVPIIVSISYPLFYDKPHLLRIIPTFFSAITLLFIFRISKAIFHITDVYSLIVQLVISASPMFFIFSQVINHEPFVLSLFLMFLYYFYLSINSNKYKIYTYILSFVSIWFDIPGLYFSIIVLLLLPKYFYNKQIRNHILSIILIQTISFFIFLQYTQLITDTNYIKFFLSITQERFGNFSDQYEYANMLFLLIENYMTIAFFTISLISLFGLLFTNIRNKVYIIILILFGIIHVVLFQKASFYHPFWFFYLFSMLTIIPIYYINFNKNKIIFIFIFIIFLTTINKWFAFTNKVYKHQDLASLDIAIKLRELNENYCVLNFDPINLIALYANNNYIPITNKIPTYCTTLLIENNQPVDNNYTNLYQNEFYTIKTIK